MKPLLEWVEPDLPPTFRDEKFSKRLRLRVGSYLFIGGLAVWGLAHMNPEKHPPPFWVAVLISGVGVSLLLWLGPLFIAWSERRWPTKVRVFQKRIVRVQGGSGSHVTSLRRMGSFYWVPQADIFLLVFVPRKLSDFWTGGCAGVRVPDLPTKERLDLFLKEQGLSETPDSERNHHARPVRVGLFAIYMLNGMFALALLIGLKMVVLENIHIIRPYGKYAAHLIVFGIPILYFTVTYQLLKWRALRAEAARRVASAQGGENE